ncbi:regulatory protein RecX [Zeaxanthinibacter enoshimensis]|uniref:Regulatory protein RecX n=1 Tax=Zeaxanthinibacter enoshimensis TaxID=392009 RepID=A0A4R6TW33_9FLAO|nr:regulatory protein RecX [Zeaxanthinibacter enoshimensis]TDQ33158.1 regulatory protein [Zeaxanthinibacter enoshimensis]
MYFSRATYTLDEARSKIESYCAYQERCHKEVREKLLKMNMIPEAIDQIIGHLIQENYLNEERFAKAFARGKYHQKSWGRVRIRMELKQRDISEFIIREALKETEEGYEETLHALALKRLEQIREKNPLKRKKKLADYLLYRGWESHLVYEKLGELIG